MSWFREMVGGEAMPPFEPDDPSCSEVEDPAIPNRMVSTKSANRPFLAYVLIMSFSIKSKRELKARIVIERTARDRKNCILNG